MDGERSAVSGERTQEDPYRISTPAQLNEIRRYLNAQFKLVNDIDMGAATSGGGVFYNGGLGWKPLGGKTAPFTGVINGAGYIISNLHVRNPADGYAGLFAKNSGTISRLGLVDCEITVDGDYAEIFVGSIAGSNAGTIKECYNMGRIYAACYHSSIGGISNGGTIEKCFNMATVSGYGYYGNIGGIAGMGGTVKECYNAGSMTLHGDNVGALIGEGGTLTDCYYTNKRLPAIGWQFGISENPSRKTDEEMTRQSTFEGFDFADTWVMSADESFPCPVLKSVRFEAGAVNTIDFEGGRGLVYDPYKISTPEQLDNIRKYPGANYRLTGNIDMAAATSSGGAQYHSGNGWIAVGGDFEDAFCGSIDGAGYAIDGLISNDSTETGTALIMQNDGVIKNLSLKNVNIQSHGIAAAIAACNSGIIEKCCSRGTIYGQDDCGGIAARSDGKITYCNNAAQVNSDSSFESAGGIVGDLGDKGEVSCCYNAGSILLSEPGGRSGWGGAGGIVGWALYSSYSKITNCFNIGSVSVEDEQDSAGGISGVGIAEASHCYNAGTISGQRE